MNSQNGLNANLQFLYTFGNFYGNKRKMSLSSRLLECKGFLTCDNPETVTFAPINFVTLNRHNRSKKQVYKILWLKRNFQFSFFFMRLSMVTKCKKNRCTKFLWLTLLSTFWFYLYSYSQSSQTIKKTGVQKWLWA